MCDFDHAFCHRLILPRLCTTVLVGLRAHIRHDFQTEYLLTLYRPSVVLGLGGLFLFVLPPEYTPVAVPAKQTALQLTRASPHPGPIPRRG